MTAEQEIVITAPKPEDYSGCKTRFCRACGTTITRWDRVLSFIKGGIASVAEFSYCEGAKPIATDDLSLGAMLTGRTERINTCAGIVEPHLHVRCRRCGFQYFMATAAPIRKGGLTA